MLMYTVAVNYIAKGKIKMAYIKVVLSGHKSNGGYLTIMKPNMDYYALRAAEKKLHDDDIIYLPNGPQTIRIDAEGIEKRYSVQSELNWRKSRATGSQYSESKFNRYFEAAKAADALQQPWETTIEVTSKTLVTVTINSDYNGRILGSPNFDVEELSYEEYEKLNAIEEKRQEEEEKIQEENTRIYEENESKRKKKTRIRTAIIWGLLSLFCISGVLTIKDVAFIYVIGLLFCLYKLIKGLINP